MSETTAALCALLRAARERAGLTLDAAAEAFARARPMSGQWTWKTEVGTARMTIRSWEEPLAWGGPVGQGLFPTFAAIYGADGAEMDRWCVAARGLPDALAADLLARPDLWPAVRALLAGGGR